MINYIKIKEDGTQVATNEKPTWGSVSTSGDYFINGKWYDKNGTVYTNQFTYFSEDGKLLAFEIQDGSIVDIHKDDTESNETAPFISVPSIQADTMVANEYKGKNACTAWVNFDGTTTPPTIRDSFNVSSVVRIGTGSYKGFYSEQLISKPVLVATASYLSGTGNSTVINQSGYSLDYFIVEVGLANTSTVNDDDISVLVFGGKNA